MVVSFENDGFGKFLGELISFDAVCEGRSMKLSRITA